MRTPAHRPSGRLPGPGYNRAAARCRDYPSPRRLARPDRKRGDVSDLRLRRRQSWNRTVTEVVDAEPDTLAHVGYSIVAATLAEPLRRALDVHLDEHGCGTGDV